MMLETLPQIFHTASIWLTLALAMQRYIYVCHALAARSWCTMARTRKAVGLIYFFAFLHQATRYVSKVIRLDKYQRINFLLPFSYNKKKNEIGLTIQLIALSILHISPYVPIFWYIKILLLFNHVKGRAFWHDVVLLFRKVNCCAHFYQHWPTALFPIILPHYIYFVSINMKREHSRNKLDFML